MELAYTRVSTDEQAMSGLGLEHQAAALRRAFEYRGWELVETIADEGVSGSTLNRPGLRARWR
jgi:DNA invertase Pin-like site-specific DNA recombinase